MPIPILVKNGRPILWRLSFLLGAAVLGGAAFWFGLSLCPTGRGSTAVQTVEIPHGAGMARITALLSERDLIRSRLAFRIWARAAGADREIKAGSYALSPGMSAPEILAILTDGREMTVRVTIPEGADLKEIAALLDSAGVAEPATFLARAHDENLIREVAPDAETGSLEGFLFPDTYFFSRTAGVDGAIRMMADRFSAVMTLALRDRAKELGRSVQEITILASLIEREAKRPEDRPRIAAVFYNRLRLGMPLQSCATVQYALGEHKERLLYKDLQVASPYNTYIHPGLPPGPICSPGLASLRAALYPDNSDYLYFVARPDGSHVFSSRYQEHLRAQREIAREK